MERGKRLLLCAHNRGRFVLLIGELRARLYGMTKHRREVSDIKETFFAWPLPACLASAWLTPHVGRRCADEAVARDKPMIEKRQRLVRSERRQPQRQAGHLHGRRIEIDAEQASLCDLATKRHAIGARDIGVMPAAVANQRRLGRGSNVPACGDEERAAAHCGIEDPQLEDLFGALIDQQRPQGAANEVIGQASRCVERAGRFPNIASSRQLTAVRLVIKNMFVDRAQLLDVEVAIGDAAPAGRSTRRCRADRQHRLRHDLVINRVAIERAGT